eukprot:scaffold13574_cov35-Phaeocystis_antarctica.AAC.1
MSEEADQTSPSRGSSMGTATKRSKRGSDSWLRAEDGSWVPGLGCGGDGEGGGGDGEGDGGDGDGGGGLGLGGGGVGGGGEGD